MSGSEGAVKYGKEEGSSVKAWAGGILGWLN